MVRSKKQMQIDFLMLVVIVVAVYYLRVQVTGETYSPAEGFEALQSMIGWK